MAELKKIVLGTDESTVLTESDVQTLIDDSLPGVATDTETGTVKLDSENGIKVNTDGQLEVGGRLGQFPTTTGIYAPDNREPRNVNDYSFMITDAKGMDMTANRAFALVTGLGVTCRSASAGATQYRVANTYSNRILCKMAENGYASRDEATSKEEQIVPIVSIQIGGSDYIPDSSANPSGTANDIIITTAETLNPSTTITNIRLFGKMTSYATAHIGNGVATWGGGRNFMLGGGIVKDGNGNDNCVVSNGAYVNGNGNAVFGRYHVIRKNRGFFAGQGHDSTNATGEGVSAIGQYSYIDANTLFAVGNGSNHTSRLNAMEVLKDGRVKVSGTPLDNDDLATKAYVDNSGGGSMPLQTFGNADFTYEKVTDPETGAVVNECIPYSTVTGNAEEPKAVKYGRMVNLTGAFKNVNVRPSNATFVMGKVPSGCEPLYRQSVLVQGTTQSKFLLTIEKDGTLKCARYSTGATANPVPDNAWLNINATYVSAS